MFPYYGQPVPKLEHYLFCVDARYSVNDSSGKNDMWLQISPVMSGYLHPGLQQYWILESNALAYTEETKPFLRAPVFLAEDTLDADGKAIELPYPNVWILNSRNGDRASIGAMGGIDITVNQSDIIYPDLSTYGIFNLRG
jgi:hypothetical protein